MPPQDPFNLGQAKDTLNKGMGWYQRGCHREAARFFTEGLVFARLADNPNLIVVARNSLGAALLADGQLEAAARSLGQALELTETLPDRPELDSVLGNLGSLSFKANRLKDAEMYWQKALEFAPEPRKAIYLANLARLSQANKSPERISYIERALEASKTKDVPISARADALALAASLAIEREDRPLAWTFLSEALEIDRQTENLAGLAQDLELSAKLRLAERKIPEAAQDLDRSFYLWAALGGTEGREGVKRLLALLRQTHQQGHPKDLAPYLKVQAKPQAFDPLGESCP
jgi:tetratricopeptide (TPR) repeat protein